MARTAARVVALAILAVSIGGCGDGSDSEEVDATEAEPTEDGLTQAIEDYWDLLAGEDYAEAYAVLSDGCHDDISEDQFTEGFAALFDQAASDGFDPTAQVVRVVIDPLPAGGDERVRTVQWSLAPEDDPDAEETVSITGGDEDTWAFDGEWHGDVPECGGGVVAANQGDETEDEEDAAGSTSEFCAVVAEYEALIAQIHGDDADPADTVRGEVERARIALDAVVARAPEELAADVTAVAALDRARLEAVEAAGFDDNAFRPPEFFADVVAVPEGAEERIADACGLGHD